MLIKTHFCDELELVQNTCDSHDALYIDSIYYDEDMNQWYVDFFKSVMMVNYCPFCGEKLQ